MKDEIIRGIRQRYCRQRLDLYSPPHGGELERQHVVERLLRDHEGALLVVATVVDLDHVLQNETNSRASTLIIET